MVVALASGAVSTISVVIPARNEARRIGPLLRQLGADATAAEVHRGGRRVDGRYGRPRRQPRSPGRTGKTAAPGWVGKPWALDQGLRVARGEWVVTMDADAEAVPGLPAALVERAQRDGLDFVSLAGRFRCPTSRAALAAPQPADHPRLPLRSTRLVPDAAAGPRRGQRAVHRVPARRASRGRRASGQWPATSPTTSPSSATWPTQGWRTALLDGTEVFTVRMHADARDAWTNWGRSLPMPDVTSPSRQAR